MSKLSGFVNGLRVFASRKPLMQIICGLTLLSFLGASAAVAQEGAAEKSPDLSGGVESLDGQILVISVSDGDLEDSRRLKDLGEVLEKAEVGNAAGIVFDLNCRSGDARRALELMENIHGLEIPTVAYANPSAVAGGAMLACGADEIYLSPSGRIGGAAPTLPMGKELSKKAQDTVLSQGLSIMRAQVRAIAKLKGRDPEIAEAFVDSSRVVTVGGSEITEKGEILVLDAEQAAAATADGRAFVTGVANNLEEVIEAAGLQGKRMDIEPATFLSDLKAADEEAKTASNQNASDTSDIDSPALVGATGNSNSTGTSDLEESSNTEENPADDGIENLRLREDSFADKVVLIEVGVEDLVNKRRFEFMSRMISKASDEGASAIIFEMDTPGGYAWDTNTLMMDDLQAAKVPTYTLVNPRALSAGALIAIATDAIYMAPASSIGAATPVSGGGGSMGDDERAKYNSAYTAMARSTAKAKGHRIDVVEGMIDMNKELIVGGEVLFGKGEIVTLDSEQATMMDRGRPLLAKGIANSVEEVMEAEGLEGEIVHAKPTGFERIAELVTRYAAILIAIGMVGAYTEMKAPGFGVAGGISLLAFGIFFFGHYMAGGLAGWEAVCIFLVGLVLIALEVFVLPGVMIAGALGFFMMIGSLVWVMASRDFTIPEGKSIPVPSVPGGLIGALVGPSIQLAIGLAISMIAALVLMRFLPKSRALNWITTTAEIGGRPETGAGTAPTGRDDKPKSKIGEEGVTETALRPAGKALFGDQLLDVVADGDFVESGKKIRIISIDGSRALVEAVEGSKRLV